MLQMRAQSFSGVQSASTLAIGTSIGEGAYGLALPSGVFWCQLPGGTAALNDIAHPSYRDRRKDHQIQLKCTRAGTVGALEPNWPEVGQEIDDGSARWLVERCTSAMNQNPGYFHIAMEMLGWPLDLVYTVGGPGQRSDFIIEHARRAVNACNPGVIFVSDLFSNDISQYLGVLEDCRQAWNGVETFLDEQADSGCFLIVQGVAPGSMFNTPELRRCASFFHTKLSDWCHAHPQASLFWQGNAEEVASLVAGENWNPDNVTTYQISTGIFDKITDGIHPQNVAQWRLAQSFAQEVAKLRLTPFQFQDSGFQQRWENSRNIGTAGTKYDGITGTVTTGWSAGRDGVATAVCSHILRDDGVSGYWWDIAASSANGGRIWANRAVDVAGLGFNVGDEIEFAAELAGIDMSPTAFVPRIEIAFYNATEYAAFASMNYTGGQQFGQAMASDNIVQVMKPIPFRLKVPNGSTNIAVTLIIEGSGSWSGTLRLGRINVINRSL